jgi:SAM-dependent methyltransferase
MDVLTVVDNRLSAHGWMFQPGHPFETIEAYLDGRPVGPVRYVSRPDVAKVFEWVKDVRPLGFAIEIVFEGPPPMRLDLVGCVEKAPVARLSFFVPAETDKQLPQPPNQLAERVSGLNGPAFRAQGLRMFTDLMDQMARLRIPAAGRILDWGCGCGRVAQYFMVRVPEAKILGCDIDGQAIEWCRQNLGIDFIRIEPAPPTPFKDADVDVIIACSVLTHLSEADQDKWLEEMRRILAPGGYFLASTNGDFAFQLAHRGQPGRKKPSIWKRLVGSGSPPRHLCGIRDSKLDTTLDGIAPPGYYRAVFQSRDHTVKVCSKYFQVLDYVERGLNGHQDLIILRRAE